MASQMRYQVAIIIGSESDMELVEDSRIRLVLTELEVPWVLSILSAHRHPKELAEYCDEMFKQGTGIFIAVAGKAAALAGAIAANLENKVTVLGVPLESKPFGVIDSLLAMVSLPKGVLVQVPGIGKDGLYNAGLIAARQLAGNDPDKITAWNRYKDQEDAKKPPVANRDWWSPVKEEGHG